ncbi:hypothetical protein [Citricoccus alkalitolerans]|uniref:Uncharacterized protein n=1 Tax=Citricoccus alkalitolerans TaxID=246603 RepID=A0ABV8XYW2_9MICC
MTHPMTDTGGTAPRTTAPATAPNGQHPRQARLGRKAISPLGRTERLMRVRIHEADSGSAPGPIGSLTTGPWSRDADSRRA